MNKAVMGSGASSQQIVDDTGQRLTTDDEKGRAFLRRYQEQLQQQGEETLTRAIDDLNGRLQANDGDEPEIAMEELLGALKLVRKNTAPGPDGVTYADVKSMTDEDMEELLQVINESMKTGIIPESWGDCKMAALPKPFKNHALLKGYRLITMANVWIKLCEKVAARRIMLDLEQRGCLPATLGGARPGRSTTVNVEAVTHHLAQAMQQSKCGALAAYDLEDAYNRVDIGLLTKKLTDLGISDKLTRWTVALIGKRKCQLRYGSWKSDLYTVSSGLPQGSPLSAVLFNVYTQDLIRKLQQTGTTTYSFVDDIIVEAIADSVEQVTAKQQQASAELGQWVQDNRQSIQSDKSQWMIISRAHIDRPLYKLTFQGKEVPQVELLICLGVAIDKQMTMAKHLDHLRGKAAKSLPLLRYAANQNVTQKSLLSLMKATVDSRMQYGLHLASATAVTAQAKLQQVQNEAVRIVTGAAKPTAVDSLRYWLGINNIKEVQELAACREFLRVLGSKSHPLRDELEAAEDTKVAQRLKTVKSWVCTAREAIETICPVENIYIPDWVRYMGPNLRTAKIGGRSWRDMSSLTNQALIRAWIEEGEFSTIIATDGSIRGDVTAWGGAVWRNNQLCFEWSTAREGASCSYRSECEAFEDALVWMSVNATAEDRTVILQTP